jgi:cytochrome c-type biogenesis protein CcmF
MALAPNIKWIKNSLDNFLPLTIIIISAIFLNVLIINFFKPYSIQSSLITISSLFLIIHTLIDLIKCLKKKVNLDYSRIVSHLGFGLLVFFIGINHNFSIENDFNLKIGEKKIFENYKISFNSVKIEEQKNYKTIIGLFNITNLKDLSQETLKPEIRIYSNPETLTYETSIKSKLSYDLYLTMSNINRSDFYNIKFQKKPFMIWVWISAMMIALGGFMRIFKSEH